jgi:hypothetical protein
METTATSTNAVPTPPITSTSRFVILSLRRISQPALAAGEILRYRSPRLAAQDDNPKSSRVGVA